MSKALSSLLNPKSIAIIGAAREEGKVGHVILDNITKAGFKGDIYPVNPMAVKIHDLKCYPSISSIKKAVDLAVIVTPAKTVPSVISECGQNNIDYAVIISAGFKETSLDGAHLEKEVLDIAKKYSIRFVGPNCLGIINAQTGLNASFTRVGPIKGNVAFISQSGALQTAILDMSKEMGIGFSKFVSLGNKADLNEVDFLEALSEDPKTSVICLYLEGVSQGRRFLESAGKISQIKPIIALKAGKTEAGARAVSSHTGTLAGSAQAYNAAFTQTGVIQPNSLEQLFSFAIALSKQPIPKGNRLGILTNAGGPAILASDYAQEAALNISTLDRKTINKLSAFLPAAANTYNPVDLLGDALADRYKKALSLLENDPNVDNVLVILTPQAMTEIQETARLIASTANASVKPFITAFMGGAEVEQAIKILQKHNIPNYIYPEDAVKAMGSLVTYSRIKSRPKSVYNKYNVDEAKVEAILKKAREKQRINISYLDANHILQAYGIRVADSYLAKTRSQAASAARKINSAVVMKILSEDIVHKTDIGGVKINVIGAENVKDEFENIINNSRHYMPQAGIEGVLVQKMIPDAQETIVGISRDPQFGPLILFGLGGIYVEVMKDVSFRIAPVSTMDVKIMLSEVKSYLLLKGTRGAKSKDIRAIEDVILRVSQLVTDFEEIVEMDINPLMVLDDGKGAIAADIRMSISLK